MEEPFYFENAGANLFAVLHKPCSKGSKNPKVGLVFCSPLAEEKLRSHRVMVNFARFVSEKGYFVLRFDYMGHGDSDGDFENSTVETRLADISRAIEVLLEKSDVEHIGVFGLRFGATLAILTCERNDKVSFGIFWEPLINIKKYFQKCLRSNLATQISLHGKVLKTRSILTEDLLSGKSVNIDGYLFSSDFYRQAVDINIMKEQFQITKPVQVIKIGNNLNNKQSVENAKFQGKILSSTSLSEYRTVNEEFFWKDLKRYFQSSEVLFKGTIPWLKNVIKYGSIL